MKRPCGGSSKKSCVQRADQEEGSVQPSAIPVARLVKECEPGQQEDADLVFSYCADTELLGLLLW
jgi:hypothetical protein